MVAGRNPKLRRVIAVVMVLMLVAGACGSDGGTDGGDDATDTGDDSPDDDSSSDDSSSDGSGDDSSGDDSSSDDGEPIVLTDSWRGVTSEAITVGIAMLDFETLTELNLSPAGWGNQQGIFESLIADLNDRGGINGRMIEAVYDFYSPIDSDDSDRSCGVLTEDTKSFAVLGGFVGPKAGTSDKCIVGLNETTLVGGEITADELAQARAPWFHAGPTVEFQTINLLNLLVQTGETEGARVFVMGGAAAADERDFVVDELEARDIEVVGSVIIEAPDGDTIAQDQELEVAFELFKSSGADTLMLFGTPSAQIRGAGNAGLTGSIAIWSNDSGGLANLGSTITDRSIADGALTSTGLTDEEIWLAPAFQDQCVAPVEARLAETDFRNPLEYAEDEENWFNPLRRYCHMLSIFEQVATLAGGDLTPASFEQAAFGGAFADFTVPGLGPTSLSPQKLGAQDLVRLSAYDSTVGDGGLTPVTDLLDAFP